VRIVVTGGFHRDRIAAYEAEGVPVDGYGVGSSLLRNDLETNTDFTLDVVRIFVNGQWLDMAKVGRQPGDNADLQPVDLSAL
jgi:nicotinate phosphoribosyltransferase